MRHKTLEQAGRLLQKTIQIYGLRPANLSTFYEQQPHAIKARARSSAEVNNGAL